MDQPRLTAAIDHQVDQLVDQAVGQALDRTLGRAGDTVTSRAGLPDLARAWDHLTKGTTR